MSQSTLSSSFIGTMQQVTTIIRKAITRSTDFESLGNVLSSAILPLHIDTFALLHVCGNQNTELELLAVWERHGQPYAPRGTRMACTDDVLFARLSDTAPLIWNDSPQRNGLFSDVLHKTYGVSAGAAYPLTAEGIVLGMFWVGSQMPRTFTAEELAMVALIADWLSMALAMIERQSLLTTQVQRVHILYQVNEALVSITDADQLLNTAVNLLVNEVGYVNSWIGLIDTDADLLRGHSGTGVAVPPELVKIDFSLQDQELTLVKVVHEAQPVVLDNVYERAKIEGWEDIALSADLRTVITVPMRLGSEVLGVISVGSNVARVAADEVGLLSTFANHLTSTMMRIRLENERHRQLAILQESYDRQARLIETVRELSSPAIPVHDGIIVMPLVGHIDTARSTQIMETLLSTVARDAASVVIIDITGVPMVDTGVANHLIQVTRAASLLGARCILVGITPRVAQTVVQLGIDLGNLITRSNLQSGIAYGLSLLNLHICPLGENRK